MSRTPLVALILALVHGAAPAAERSLYEAARDGDLATVERRLAAGADPHQAPFGHVDCPLAVAANQGYSAIVAALLAAGSRIDCGYPGYPPLAAAARGGHLETVELLLSRGAGTGVDLSRALLLAAEEGHPRTAARLVAAGADLAARDGDGLAPLLVAARAGRAETVRTLLDLGAAPDAVDAGGRTALHWASWRRHPDVVRLLLARGARDVADASGDRALLAAASLDEALAAMSAARERAATRSTCDLLPLAATAGARTPGELTAWNAPRAPAVGELAWAIADGATAAVRARVVAVGVDACAGELFEPQLALEAAAPAGAGDGYTVLLGAPSPPRRLAQPTRAELPWGVFPQTVTDAFDLDGDGRADALRREFCCGDDWLAAPRESETLRCEYVCTESWWRAPDGWRLCAEGGPC